MSYTFSRRDFMKYSALTAVAVAGSSLLTGCSDPNQPTGKTGDKLKIIGYHTLNSAEKKDDGSYVFNVTHKPNSSIEITAGHYELIVTDADGNTSYYNVNTVKSLDPKGDIALSKEAPTNLAADKEATFDVIFTGIPTILSDAKTVLFRYWPRNDALGKENDSYHNVFATWTCTADVV